ncbi:uncharacterized protein LAESUDRAFT_690144 [Laetiporus sulphureus 93-53]|uniref:Uncharacterized protein n=1 Tax=Laetiporus sulphureus 93-53 TaxID=1314785 RepID=A0A165IGG2_9APHY|nr:uncharacterized protein LAESUDRAFT_690144 [Laetiporus sulphureus 93-53]KZT13039.1 hypothetical protein LAESUDRAFT_690144 [Laetiporus sulphureus 93-53]
MDDDISLGASVWGAPASPVAIKPISAAFTPTLSSEDGFDDFKDFHTPAETTTATDEEVDDDFGDFGDFGGPQGVEYSAGFDEEVAFGEEVRIPGPSGIDWQPLRLDPSSSRQDLQEQVDHILGPLWVTIDASQMSDKEIREAAGLSQTLVTSESRKLFDLLLPSAPPAFQPVNWTRSRIRRRHLISLGIPVNLDEVLPRANGKLPALEITTRPMSAPPGPRTAPAPRSHASTCNSAAGSPRPGTPQTAIAASSSAAAQLRLGPRPELNETKLSQLLDLNPDKLLQQPISALEKYLADLQAQTINTSTVLTYLLQTRDALQQDSETYNKLIGEMVGEAQKIKTGKRLGGSKRSTLS